MKRRALLFLTAVMVFLCAFSALADGVEMTFSISVYDRTTGTYLLENRVVTAEAPFTYVDTLSILSEQYGISAECDEKGWPTAVYGTDASVQSSGTASFYIKVNGAVMDEWQADEFVENGCIIEWIFSEQAPDFSGKNIFETNAAIVWNEKQASALKEAGGWLARQSGESAGYCMALSAAGQPIRSGFVVSLPNRDFAKKDPCSVAEELLLLSVCGYGEDTPAVQTCLALLSKAQIDKRDVMLCSMILRAYDCRRYELPAETKNTREALTRYLLVAQNEDGGFGKTRGFASSFEATAEAVAALSMYDDVQAEDAVRRGVSYLSGWLRENGIAPAGELSSAQTAARAVTAMACVGLIRRITAFLSRKRRWLKSFFLIRMRTEALRRSRESRAIFCRHKTR